MGIELEHARCNHGRGVRPRRRPGGPGNLDERGLPLEAHEQDARRCGVSRLRSRRQVDVDDRKVRCARFELEPDHAVEVRRDGDVGNRPEHSAERSVIRGQHDLVAGVAQLRHESMRRPRVDIDDVASVARVERPDGPGCQVLDAQAAGVRAVEDARAVGRPQDLRLVEAGRQEPHRFGERSSGHGLGFDLDQPVVPRQDDGLAAGRRPGELARGGAPVRAGSVGVSEDGGAGAVIVERLAREPCSLGQGRGDVEDLFGVELDGPRRPVGIEPLLAPGEDRQPFDDCHPVSEQERRAIRRPASALEVPAVRRLPRRQKQRSGGHVQGHEIGVAILAGRVRQLHQHVAGGARLGGKVRRCGRRGPAGGRGSRGGGRWARRRGGRAARQEEGQQDGANADTHLRTSCRHAGRTTAAALAERL